MLSSIHKKREKSKKIPLKTIFFTVQDDESSERDSGTGDSKRSYDNMEHVVDTVIHSFLAARGEGWSISPPPP